MSKSIVYTIIVTYNGMQWIQECLNSVIQDTKVVVIDNNSSDETISFIQKNYPEVIVLPQGKNLGFGAANNLGISYALNKDAKFVLLLNQDAKMGIDAVQTLTEFAAKNNQYGILSPIHCDWTGNYLESSFASYVTYENNENFYSDFVLSKPLKAVYNVPFIAAACWFIPTTVFEKVGGFDPIFFHSGEDNNLTQRIQYHGYEIGVLPKITVDHDTKDRDSTKLVKYSDVYFNRLNYRLKAKYANVNIDNVASKIKYQKKQIYKDCLMAFFQFQFQNLFGSIKELKLYTHIQDEVLNSIAINRIEGKHYL